MCCRLRTWLGAVAGRSCGCRGTIGWTPNAASHPERDRFARRRATRTRRSPVSPSPVSPSHRTRRRRPDEYRTAGRPGRVSPTTEAKRMTSRTRERRRLSIRYFDDRIVLTHTYAWAYYRMPTVPYEFTTPEEREALATNITIALAAIRMADAEVHLRIVHRSYPAPEWARRLDSTSAGGPRWLAYLHELHRHVCAKDFWAKEVYLGVRLGPRGMRMQPSRGVVAPFISLYQRSEKALGLDDEAVDDGEIAKWTE